MLEFNELRITPDNKYLIVDVSVMQDSYYDNVYIGEIVIYTQDTFTSGGSSDNPIYTYKNTISIDTDYLTPVIASDEPVLYTQDIIHGQVYVKNDSYYILDNNAKRVRLLLSPSDLGVSLDKNMFFVYAVATGNPSEETPEGFKNIITMGTVVDLYPIYKNTIKYLKEFNCDCNIPRKFIDMILRYKALELCIKTGNYIQAIKYWDKFFKNNCNGRIN